MARQYIEIEEYNWANIIVGWILIIATFIMGERENPHALAVG
jgi:hypothetical protein